MKKKLRKYPHWVCSPCGVDASKGRQFLVSTFHVGKCEVCLKTLAVTEARDFYYPKFKGFDYNHLTEMR